MQINVIVIRLIFSQFFLFFSHSLSLFRHYHHLLAYLSTSGIPPASLGIWAGWLAAVNVVDNDGNRNYATKVI